MLAYVFISIFYLLSTAVSTNPSRLFNMSLNTIEGTFSADESKILKIVYPKLFNPDLPPEFSGIFLLTSNEPLHHPSTNKSTHSSIIETVDLSDLNIERISVRLSAKMKLIKVLNLANNPLLKLKEPWVECFYENLEELNLNECYLDDGDFHVIENFKKLEKLSVSGTKNLNISSESFIRILSKLKYLDVSNCKLDIHDFLLILKNSPRLQSLNFANNNLKDIEGVETRNGSLYVTESESKISTNKRKRLEEIKLNINNLHSLNLRNCSLECEEFIRMLFNLPYLESLILSENSINFNFEGVSNNSSLKRLELADCDIDKVECLNEFTNFAKLEILDLSSNNFIRLKGVFKIGSSKDSLVELNISESKFQTNRLKEFTKCSKIQRLDASGNLFGFMSEDFDFDNLKNTVTDLNISGCRLSVYNGLNALSNFTKLQRLNFSSNFLDSITESFDFKCLKDTLIELSIVGCNLDKRKISFFTDFPNLKIFNASHNYSDSNFILRLGCSKHSLETVILESCNLNEEDLREISNCSRLKELNVSNNDFEMIDEHFEFGNLKNTLQYLNMSTSNLITGGLKALTKLLKLRELDVSLGTFTIPEDFDFGNLKKTLTNLDLMNCDLDLNSLKALTNFHCLEQLNFSGNAIGDIPDDFNLGNLKNTLEDLEVYKCDMNANGLKAISKCLKLQNLWFEGNSLEYVPDDLGNLNRTLVTLNISECKVKPEFMTKIIAFSRLQKLWVSNNLLKDMPCDFGNLKHTLVYLEIKHSGVTKEFINNAITQCSKIATIVYSSTEKIRSAADLNESLNTNSNMMI